MTVNANALRIAQRFNTLTKQQRRAVYQKIIAEGMHVSQFPILPRDGSLRNRCSVSYAQQRQWFLWRLDPESTAYHVAGAVMLRGELNAAALRDSFARLYERHESLRTVFATDADETVVQHIFSSAERPLQVQEIDLSCDDSALRAQRLDVEIRRLRDTLFDLCNGPLLRVATIRLASDQHVLVLAMHHIISDGWSLQIIINEFVAHYCARVSKIADATAASPLHYADYALWQRNWLEAGENQRQLAYWRQQLGTEHPVLQLPVDFPRTQNGRHTAALFEANVPDTVVRGLRTLVNAMDTTLFSVLLAAFQCLLHRYTGARDIRVGVPIANRHRVETEGVVGFFVNTQVLRAQIDSADQLDDILVQVRSSVTGAQDHQDLPFEQLVEDLQPERILGTNPLFQVLFNHQQFDHRSLQQMPGLDVSEFPLGEQAAQFELTLDITETTDGKVSARFAYAAELFDEKTIARTAGHYINLLRKFAEQPQSRIGDAELLSDAELARLHQWGVNDTRYPQAPAVHWLFEQQVAAHPQATALIFGETSINYAALNHSANQLAHHLIDRGIGVETKIGIAMQRSVEMVVAALGVLKAGAAYVPLDPEYPPERLAYMMEDSNIALLLTQEALLSQLPIPSQLPTLALDALLEKLSQQQMAAGNPAVALHDDSLAYVIYTSGSTGKPKGVAVSHAPLSMHCQETALLYEMDRHSRELHFVSFSFDGGQERLLTALTCGASLVLRDSTLWTADKTLATLQQQHVTNAGFPPAYLCELASAVGDSAVVPPVSLYSFGGDAMPREGFDAVCRHLQPQILINGYGPTEAVVTPVLWKADRFARFQSGYAPIGRPVGDRTAYVLDADLNRVPQGVPGELYLGGAGLARGYLGKVALTAERFVADPFDQNGGRLYRTGDSVRWNADGQLEYLGRIDYQIKIRGFRVEPGEIEAQLLQQANVREAVVVVQSAAASARLIAYVSAQESTQIDGAQLRRELAQALPDYMVPSAIVVLEKKLPLSPNGKIERKALPAVTLDSECHYEAPQGAAEQSLAQVWAQVLEVTRVGRNDNFFDLGGHSLLAIRLLEQLRQHGWQTDIRVLFRFPRFGDFAAQIFVEMNNARPTVVVPPNGIPQGCTSIQPDMLTLVALEREQIRCIEAAVPGGAANIQDIYPLAPLQEGILFHHLLNAENDPYVTPCLLSFDSSDRLQQFVANLNRVIARHDALRTAVLWEGLPEPVQVVWRDAAVAVEWLEVLPGEAQQQLNYHIASAHFRIDVRQAPMIRAVAVADPLAQRWLLQLPSHHLALDHTTLELLVEEITLLMHGNADQLPVPVPFRDFVALARLGISVAEHEAYFRQMLDDVDEPTAPFDLLDVRGDGTATHEVTAAIAPQLARAIREQARSRGVSAATLFHLAWAMVLAKTSGRDDVVFGTVLFGRMQGGAEAARAMGMFINTLPLRVQLNRSLAQCLQQTHQALTDLLYHEHASLMLVQRCSALPSGTPLFSSLLNYRYSPAQEDDITSAWEGMLVLGGKERTNFPLDMSVDDLGDDFALVLQASDTIDANAVCDLFKQVLQSVVGALASDDQVLPHALDVLPGDMHTQLRHWGENETRHSQALPVHRLFEQQAATQLQATALVFGDVSVSYEQLNQRANQLARQLIERGIGIEARVGIAMQRSVDLIVALLAVLKTGAAYVPLDPDYPAERLAYMIDDSNIALLLTQQALLAPLSIPLSLPTLALETLPVSQEVIGNPAIDTHHNNLAYVIYTSGSTGKPKAVGVAHGVFTEHMQVTREFFALTGNDRVLQFATINFDASLEQLFAPLITGASIVLRGDEVWDSTTFHRELLQKRITVVDLSTSYATLLVQEFAQRGVRDYGDLRRWHVGGEALSSQFPALWRAAGLEQITLLNTYGPTETAVTATVSALRPSHDIDATSAPVPIGKPLPGRCVYVLDHHLAPVPVGVAGELYIGGDLLARGYLGKAALTAERFIADPFAENGGRLYRTGDRVRWHAGGELEYLGRIDQQIKIRGFRVEPGEIEAQLLLQENVREAVVVVQGEATSARLLAYVSAQDAAQIDGAQLRRELAQTLPDYMVPSAIVVLDKLPLSPNGKIERKALPAVNLESERHYEAPQGDVEQALAQLWASVLDVTRVGRHDNFFDLGGHSLAAIQIKAQLVQRHGCDMEIRLLFDNPTVATLALQLPVELFQENTRSSRLAAMDQLLAEFEV